MLKNEINGMKQITSSINTSCSISSLAVVVNNNNKKKKLVRRRRS